MCILVIDGANVVGSRPDGWWRDRPGAARRLSVVEVLERVVEVEKPVTVVKRVEVPVAPKRGAWPGLLADLAKQIDAGRV